MRALSGWGTLLLLLASAVTTPAIAESPANGSLTARGQVAVTGTTGTTLGPLALLASDSANLRDFTGAMDGARLCVHEQRVREVVAVRFPTETQAPECSTHDRLQVVPAEASDHAGWPGIVPGSGSRVTLSAPAFAAEPRPTETLSSERNVSSGEADDAKPFYIEQAPGPLLYIEQPGAVTFTGPGKLKVMGLDFWTVSEGHRSKVETGRWVTESGTIKEHRWRWAVITFTTGTLDFNATAPVRIAAKDAAASFDGKLACTPTVGTLRAGGRDYAVTDEPATIAGRFTADLKPNTTGTLDITLAGSLRGTSLQPKPAPTLAGNGVALWLVGLFAVAVVGGGAVAILARRRTRAKPRAEPNPPAVATSEPTARAVVIAEAAPPVVMDSDAPEPAAVEPAPSAPVARVDEDPEESAASLLHRARAAAARKDWTTSAALFELALHRAPGERAAWLDLGHVRYNAGQYPEALAIFTRARLLDKTGEAELMAAMCLAAVGQGESAGDWLMEALRARELHMDTLGAMRDAKLRAIIEQDPKLKAAYQAALGQALDGFGKPYR